MDDDVAAELPHYKPILDMSSIPAYNEKRNSACRHRRMGFLTATADAIRHIGERGTEPGLTELDTK